jgi:large subunit ribosomal protein L13
MKIIDAKGLVAGRLASKIAKELLKGENIVVVNAAQAIVSGKLENEIKRLNSLKRQKSKQNPEHSPKYPRIPHLLFKRMVRGMLPKKSLRGRQALRRLRAYSQVPQENIDIAKAERYEEFAKQPAKFTTLGEICAAYGWKPQN